MQRFLGTASRTLLTAHTPFVLVSSQTRRQVSLAVQVSAASFATEVTSVRRCCLPFFAVCLLPSLLRRLSAAFPSLPSLLRRLSVAFPSSPFVCCLPFFAVCLLPSLLRCCLLQWLCSLLVCCNHFVRCLSTVMTLFAVSQLQLFCSLFVDCNDFVHCLSTAMTLFTVCLLQ